MRRRACTLVLALALPAAAQSGPVLAVTADNGGALQGEGALPRIAGAFAELDRLHGGIVRIGAGNGLFGAQSLAHGGALAAEGIGELAYDAVHLTWRDFRLGVPFTRECVQRMGVPALSTNIVDAETGEPFAAPVVQVGPGARLALLGVTQEPAGLDRLPHLRRQLEGVRIRPPAEALAEWLPRAEEQCDGVVLVYYGSAAGLKPLLAEFGSRLRGCIAAGVDPAAARGLKGAPVVAIESGGIFVVQAGAFADGAARVAIAEAAPDPRVQNRLEIRARETRPPVTAAKSTAAEAPANDPGPLHGKELDRWLSARRRPGLAEVAGIETDPPVDGVTALALRDGRRGGRGWSVAAAPVRLTLSWPRAVGVRAAHLVLDRDSGGANVRVEGLGADGSPSLLGTEQAPAFGGLHLVSVAFDPRAVHGLRIVLETRQPVTVTEVVVDPVDEAVLASGGFNVAARATGAHLLVPPEGGGAGLHAIDGLKSVPWSLPDGAECTFVWREHRPAAVAGLRLWLPESGPRPAQVELSASEGSMFSDYYLLGRFPLEDRAGEHVISFAAPVRARYLRAGFTSSLAGAGCAVTEIEVIEAIGSASVFAAEAAVEGTTAPRIEDLTGGARLRTESEPNEDAESAGALALGEWAGGSLQSLEDVDTWRFRVAHAPDQKVRLSLHMTPFLRGALVLRNTAGELVAEAHLGAKGGHTLVWEPDLEPGEYVATLTPAPIHLLFAFDSSGSMGGTFATTVQALRTLVEELPEGMQVALATTLHDAPTDRAFSLFTPFTRDPEQVEAAIEKLFRQGGTSNWYTVMADVLPFLDREVPEDALPAMVFVADGNGRGRFRDMLAALGESRARIYSIGFGDVGEDLDTETTWDGAVGLGNLAHARHGLYQEPRGVDELLAAYRRIFADLAADAHYALRVEVQQRLPGTLATVAPPGDERPTLFVLDASGTMRDRAGDTTRMEAAKRILAEIAAESPEHVGVGLRVYGHRYRQRQDRDRAAEDSELVVAIGEPRHVLMRELERVQPMGGTPLAYSISRVAEDLRGIERPRVIVVTDGVDSFRRNPVVAAEALADACSDMELVVVGFGIGHVRDQEALRAIASACSGRYFDARDGHELVNAVREAFHPRLPFSIANARGETIASGVFGDRIELLEGSYQLRFASGTGIVVRPFRVKAGHVVELQASR